MAAREATRPSLAVLIGTMSRSIAARRNAFLPSPPALAARHALFLDFDGTLVEIAPSPERVRVPERLPMLLRELTQRLDDALAVVSGRRLDELARLLEPFAGTLVGLHGMEQRRLGVGPAPAAPPPMLAPARSLLAEFAAAHPGVLLEDKGAGLALHFRAAPETASACRNMARRAAALAGKGVAAREGKMVVEVLPPAADKGRAIAALLAEPPFKGRVPVFVGDDRTDEDGFALVNRMGGCSVQVGCSTATAARFRLPSVASAFG